MHSEPIPADPGRGEDPASGVPEPVKDEAVAWVPVVTRPDWMSEEEQRARRHLPLDHSVGTAVHHRTNPVPDLNSERAPENRKETWNTRY